MTIITFISSRTGKQWRQEFETTVWSEILSQLQDVDGMSAKLVRAGSQKLNMELGSDSVLPTVTGGYIISFTQSQMKGAHDVFDFTADDIANMSHRELNITLRTVREWAADNNQDVFTTIGNYTNLTNDAKRDLLRKVLEMVAPVCNNPVVDLAEVEELRNEVEEILSRLLTVERLLGLEV